MKRKKPKVICVMVTSLDGKSTKGTSQSPAKWASQEDQHHFKDIIASHNLIVMGRKTYEAAKPAIKHEEGKRRIIITSHPFEYTMEEIRGQLEFTSESPKELVARLEAEGVFTILLAGGSNINGLFFKAGLVDELWLTLEPKIFGSGKGLAGEEYLDVSLMLDSIERLNENGTLLLKYKVQKTN
jgi:dihydrofolate reductase